MITINQLIDIIKESIEELPVYHGTSHDFDRFNHKKYLGKGCGSQCFGWGTYVTDDKAIGKGYAKYFKDNEKYKYNGGKAISIDDVCKLLNLSPDSQMANIVYNYAFPWFNGGKGNINQSIDELEQTIERQQGIIDDDNRRLSGGFKRIFRPKDVFHTPELKHDLKTRTETIEKEKQLLDYLEQLRDALGITHGKGYLYDVDIPDNNGENYLDWYEPVDGSIKDKIITGINKLPEKYKGMIQNHSGARKVIEWIATEDYTGQKLYTVLMRLFGSKKAASLFLMNCCGFNGIIYKAGTRWKKPDGSSEDAHNYVIFNSNDGKITNRTKL